MADDFPGAASPNPAIDKAIKKLLHGIDDEPSDVAVKIVNSAVSWEKVKHGIRDKDADFDPDEL